MVVTVEDGERDKTQGKKGPFMKDDDFSAGDRATLGRQGTLIIVNYALENSNLTRTVTDPK